jgi:GTP-binding protein EngB required for normal cell division
VLIHNIIIEIDNEKAKETFNNVKVILENINNDVASEYNELKRNTEWENFTIAFYGETNAGKSTIIETLRIIWKETQKQKSIQRFKD